MLELSKLSIVQIFEALLLFGLVRDADVAQRGFDI